MLPWLQPPGPGRPQLGAEDSEAGGGRGKRSPDAKNDEENRGPPPDSPRLRRSAMAPRLFCGEGTRGPPPCPLTGAASACAGRLCIWCGGTGAHPPAPRPYRSAVRLRGTIFRHHPCTGGTLRRRACVKTYPLKLSARLQLGAFDDRKMKARSREARSPSGCPGRRGAERRKNGERRGDADQPADGKVTVTRVPRPTCESSAMRAWCSSAMRRAMDRPSPAPSAIARADSPR